MAVLGVHHESDRSALPALFHTRADMEALPGHAIYVRRLAALSLRLVSGK